MPFPRQTFCPDSGSKVSGARTALSGFSIRRSSPEGHFCPDLGQTWIKIPKFLSGFRYQTLLGINTGPDTDPRTAAIVCVRGLSVDLDFWSIGTPMIPRKYKGPHGGA